ncbi:L-rhamnose mutarotase [candidate division KSB1 bacterium]|nr:L-rhamnose mutarotase [candidate division KSB1 bacterium]
MRIAFKMKLKEGYAGEYDHRHNPIWPELESVLINHGVVDYTIFLDQDTNDLFGYAEIEDMEKWQKIAQTDVCQRWWKYMAPLMEVNEDYSPKSKDLRQVFHIEKK